MALSKAISATSDVSVFSDGVTFQTSASANGVAYIKVERVDSSKSAAIAYVTYSGDAVKGNKTFEFVPNLDGKNFIAQAYDYLKTLPEFAGATDC
jgi:hypothetical protein